MLFVFIISILVWENEFGLGFIFVFWFLFLDLLLERVCGVDVLGFERVFVLIVYYLFWVYRF